MAKVQKWNIRTEDGEHRISYRHRAFCRTVTLEIDGEAFLLPRGKREEIFRVGEEQAILGIGGNGRATIRMKNGIIPEENA